MHALAGLWYRQKLHEFDAHPAAAALWDGWEETMPADPYPEDTAPEDIAEDRAVVRPEYRRQETAFLAPFVGYADELLASAKTVTDAGSRDGLARLLVQRLAKALALHRKRMAGDFSPDPLRPTLPEWNPPAPAAHLPSTAPSVSLRSLFDAWKAVSVVKPRTAAETDYAIKDLREFVGHDDASRITRDDLIRWRDSIKAAGATNNTWNNRLSLLRQVFLHGVSAGVLKADITEGLRLRKSRQTSPPPYSDEEARRILLAARVETKPSLRWAIGSWPSQGCEREKFSSYWGVTFGRKAASGLLT